MDSERTRLGGEAYQYREIIRELGEALDMNWAYGVEFLEIDSKQLGEYRAPLTTGG